MEKYIVNKEIGSGSFGKVFLVESKSTGIQYVTKQIDLSKLNHRQKLLAEKEIQVLAKLNHPNIVRYKEAHADERNLHIVMELCEMGDFHELISEARMRNDYFTDSVVMDYFVQICLALEYIHQQRILHRDLKTKNIFLKKGNIVKLGDFGVAKVLENSFELSCTCIGSPFYISPEMCEGKPYDKKSDIWALGCVLFELATLKYAFTAKNMKSLMSKIAKADHNHIPENINAKIRHLIKKLLNLNPKQRPVVSEILDMPYVVEFKKKRPCRRIMSFSQSRSQSGDDLSCKTMQNNLKWKSNRMTLPISKSSVNLNCKEITQPCAKYSSKLPIVNRLWSAKKHVKATNETRNNDTFKAKKFPKVDSLYYNLIEEDSKRLEKPKTELKNIFDRSYDVLKNDEEFPAQEENFSNQGRKRWETNTSEKHKLITLLNESELVKTFQDTNLKPNTNQSIEDLLFMETTDLSHVAILTPKKIHQATRFDSLEQRRIQLEHELGLDKFLKTYRLLEEIPMNRIHGNSTYNISEPLRKIAEELHFDYDTINRVWDLVRDDSIFKQ